MPLPFREYHLIHLLEEHESRQAPLDLCIRDYFRSHKSLGSKDRAEIAENAYGILRWLGLLDAFAPHPTWAKRLEVYQKREELDVSALPEHIQVSFPEALYRKLEEEYGREKARELCLASNERAPTAIRVNRLKTTRDELLAKWKGTFDVSACPKSPNGILFHTKVHFYSMEEFQQGYFEMQDEGSQLLAGLVEAAPGEQIMDYCAGSGGKTLAFAPDMEGRGQIHLHDIRPWALEEAKKRLRRAGIQNAQILLPDSPKQKKLKQKMDRVLVDAPCSGTGTLRRNPDMKWKYDNEMLERLIGEQRTIFEKALSFVKPGGRIIYGTCSLLKEENQDQIDHFLKTYPVELETPLFQTLPAQGEMDGFFGAVMRKKSA